MFKFIERLKGFTITKEKPTVEQFIAEWSKCPEEYFIGQFERSLEWHTCYGIAPMEGLSDSHGYSMMPDIKCMYSENEYSLRIGWVESVSMYAGGTVRIKHFALDENLTREKIGTTFFEAILRFFKKHNAIIIEFHENHSSKIEHYRRFFEKVGVEEVRSGVWRVDLYKNATVSSSVLEFQKSLTKTNR